MVTYRRDGSIGIIEFNDPHPKVNLLSNQNLEKLKYIIDSIIEGARHVNALFFISKKQGIFIAGADIEELARICTKKEAREFSKKGQDLFNKIESLKVPTFAVIDGACVGGGLELALSCDYIMATENKKVKFALPEVRLGITPGWGGVHRLAERIGQKHTQIFINTGDFIDAEEAKRLNLVDKIIPEEGQFMYQKLINLYKENRSPRNRFTLHGVEKRYGFDKSERVIFSEKILKPPARSALTSYLLVSKYRKFQWLDGRLEKSASMKRAIVIGAGTMGRGIAYLMSSERDLQVNISDINKSTLKNAESYIKDIYRDAVKREIFSQDEAGARFKNISFNSKRLKEPDIVIESIIEDTSAKKQLFAKIERGLHKNSILATNTSCLSIEELSKSLTKADRFLGVHFFNPAYKMKLVEVIPARYTSREVLERVILFLQKMRRIPIIVKDSPGFLVNRMLLAYLNEAIFMLEEGFKIDEIEASMLEFGMPMGPIRLSKEIGLDVLYRAAKTLEDNFGERMKVPETLKRCAKNTLEIRRDSYGPPKKNKERDISRAHIVERLLSPMRREARSCLKEGIVNNREIIDLALLLGIGFPRLKRIWKN